MARCELRTTTFISTIVTLLLGSVIAADDKPEQPQLNFSGFPPIGKFRAFDKRDFLRSE